MSTACTRRTHLDISIQFLVYLGEKLPRTIAQYQFLQDATRDHGPDFADDGEFWSDVSR